MTSATSRRVAGRDIEVSRPEKTMFPDDDICKADLVDYYLKVADPILAHLSRRPLTMQRFPDGIAGQSFYEKKAPDHFPDWVRRVRVETRDGAQVQVVCDDAAALAYLADQACITPHIWLSSVGDLHHPDQMVFDLDPPAGDDARPVQDAAQDVHRRLDELGLTSFVKTTGSKGYHVHVPLDGRTPFDTARGFARAVGESLAEQRPDRYTVELRKDKREGRVFVDYLRNAYGQTVVPPYAVRALAGAPVATPLDWSEVSTVAPARHTLSSVPRRLAQRDDPWEGFWRHRQSLRRAHRQLTGEPH